MRLPAHPVTERKAALFHGSLVGYFVLGIALFSLGVWFHAVSLKRHWGAR